MVAPIFLIFQKISFWISQTSHLSVSHFIISLIYINCNKKNGFLFTQRVSINRFFTVIMLFCLPF